MDLLSDVMRAARLTGALFFDVRASEPWVAETPAGSAIVAKLMPGAEHLIPYHAITRGGCWAGIVGEPPRYLTAGDVIVFPRGDPHVLSSAAGMRADPSLAIYRRPDDCQLPFALTMGKAAVESAGLVCGYLGCDARPFNPLLAALPRVMHVSERAGGVVGTFVALAVAESKSPRLGGECVLSRLSELMFVEVVRRHLETLPAEDANWLAGLRDPFVGRALTALHRNASHGWTLESLGHEVGLSRTALVERFTQSVGQPPMQYLANWRMQLAANHLVSGTDTVAAIAERVGYDSEAAFSRAFKRSTGIPPGHWRKRRFSSAAPT